MEGYGIYVYADKVEYHGVFKEDKKQGYGIYKWPDGRKYVGWWFNGRQHGYGIYTGAKKEEKYGLWEHGKRLTWFNASQIESVKLGDFDYKALFKQESSDSSKDIFVGHAFDAPEGWQQGLDEVQSMLTA